MNRQLVEGLVRTIRALSSEERQMLWAEVQHDRTRDAIREKLRGYEQQYKIPSEQFYRQFMAGELGDEINYVEWAGFYETLLQR
ncbi:hypothetical protein [Alkalinema sp. FACHB-956]|uniref:hypothetical protein n=1 Tax=Alkalinema sp. FACHB-956 TaxID=2692768 RepID=UPI0016878509|nr:hypothetical protein [Alkalinema sp. FACHB-956]MBD2329570.1 hypothetical protein [Alkalinema sp. FACHB-956]